MDIYLSVTAEDYPKAAAYGSRFAFVSYGIGPDGTLTRGSLPILPAPSRTVWTFPPPVRDTAHPSAGELSHRFAGDTARMSAGNAVRRTVWDTPRQDAASREPYPREAPPLRRNLLSLTDRDAPPVENPETLCGYVCRECARRGYAGAVLDFEGRMREDLRSFAACLSRRFGETGRRLYVPEAYAAAPDRYGDSTQKTAAPNGYAADVPGTAAPNGYAADASDSAAVLMCTALSGGNFEERLREAAERRGGDRLALDVQRLRMDFTLPAPTGEGIPLDADAFRDLSEGRTVYFSPDLCARYFTFTQSGAAHFVLFDDADTLNRKLELGRRYGVRAALLQWPEISDIAGELRLN